MAEELGFRIRIDGAQEQIDALSKIKKEVTNLANEKKSLNNQLKVLSQQYEDGVISSEQYKEETSKIAIAQVDNALATKQANAAYREGEKTLLQSAKATDVAEGSLSQMRIELAQNKKAYADLSKAQRENDAVGGELLKTIQAQDAEVKELEESIGVHTRSVGDYGKAFQTATPLMGEFGMKVQSLQGGIASLTEVFSKFKSGLLATDSAIMKNTTTTAVNAAVTDENSDEKKENAASTALATTATQANTNATNTNSTAVATNAKAVRSMGAAKKFAAAASNLLSKGFKILRLAIISTGIGALVLALGSLITFFTRTQRGIEPVRKALAAVGAVVGVVIDRIAGFGEAIADFFSGDWGGALDSLTSVFAGFGDEVEREIDIAERLEQQLIAVEKAETDLIIARAASRAQVKELNKLAEDTTKSYAERSQAAKDAIAIEQELLNKQIETQTKRAETLLNGLELTEEKLNDIRENGLKLEEIGLDESTEEDRKEAAEEIAKIYNLQEQSLELQTTLQNKLNTIEQQRAAEIKKAEDDKRKAEEKAEKERKKRAAEAEKARQKRIAAEAKAEKDRIDAEKKAIDEKIKLLELERDLEIAINEETNEKKLEQDLKLLEDVTNARIEQAKLTGEDTTIIEKEALVKREQLLRAERDRIAAEEAEKQKEKDKEAEEAQKEKDKLENERIAEQQAIRQQIREGAIEAVDTVAQTAFQGQQRRIKEDQAREIAALEAKKQAGVITQQEFETARKEIDRQAFERQKKADTSRAIINGALAVGKTFAQLGFTPAAGVAVALGAVKTAAEIATIQAQKFEGFADGGFTGSGFGSPDSSGHRVAGVVHANEYVVPKKVLETTAGAALVGNLERMRMKKPTTNVSRGFIGGGFTSGNEFPSMEDLTANLIEGVSGAIQSIPVVNDPTATEDQARAVNNIQNEASFS